MKKQVWKSASARRGADGWEDANPSTKPKAAAQVMTGKSAASERLSLAMA